jgi:phosphoribosylaminoimidazolecarboxamide formyltransferase/IMP cyclohydrolase
MSIQNDLKPIRRALISVSDKTDIVKVAKELVNYNIEIISTGGTAKTLRDEGINVREVSEITGFPEMMDGRVKTLHPKIHGALLALRDNPEHLAAMQSQSIEPIDLVIINLYPFEETIADEDVVMSEAIEQIDIGGPAMIRSAAKNWPNVAVVTSVDFYQIFLDELKKHHGSLTGGFRQLLATNAFIRTSSYDGEIASYLLENLDSATLTTEMMLSAMNAATNLSALYDDDDFDDEFDDEDDEDFEDFEDDFEEIFPTNGNGHFAAKSEETSLFPEYDLIDLVKLEDLRYGENPHQQAALYGIEEGGVANAELLGGKEMSFNNYVDADAAWNVVWDFDELACAIIKHTNPSGVGLGGNTLEAYRRALATDPTSAFGGIVAFNRMVDAETAKAATETFTEAIVAPEFDDEALRILREKKNLRILRVEENKGDLDAPNYKQISGGMLVQMPDLLRITKNDLKIVSNRQPTDEEIKALLFAWKVCKHVKSNAIVYANRFQTVGVGAGQMSRVDAVKIGAMRAVLELKGAVLASDAFFPFRDGIDEAAKAGITAIIQPGGSMRDHETIAAANEHGLAMVFTGIRHFNH